MAQRDCRKRIAMKRVLMIAYHFPPLAGSSGIQRTLRFAQQLPELGWEPIVLTADPRAYERTSDDLLDEVPAGLVVERAFALDTARQLAVGGRYMGWLARPDRWMTWRFGGVAAGLSLIRRHAPDVLWSTYPIATAHVIGRSLARRTRLPWIADFRDPMAQDGYPADPATWRSFRQIETDAVADARFSTFTTPGAGREYQRRYPASADRIRVLENGFDEESFADLTAGSAREPLTLGAVTLLHSGIVYPSERDPTQFFMAIAQMADAGDVQPGELVVRFRAAGHDELLRSLAQQHGIESYIELLPPIAYRAALQEMLRADALLVLQAANCNEQIPAKLYEYLRAGRPIVTLTDPAGDTAGVVRAAGLDAIARLDDVADIVALLRRFIASVRAGQALLPTAASVASASRRGRSRELAALLDAAASPS
jgi:glycosyltransferase involved in cell wall biosynthesis